jgi:hypothetical protein
MKRHLFVKFFGRGSKPYQLVQRCQIIFTIFGYIRNQHITSEVVMNNNRKETNYIKSDISHNLCSPHQTVNDETTNPLEIPSAQAAVVGDVVREQPSAITHLQLFLNFFETMQGSLVSNVKANIFHQRRCIRMWATLSLVISLSLVPSVTIAHCMKNILLQSGGTSLCAFNVTRKSHRRPSDFEWR